MSIPPDSFRPLPSDDDRPVDAEGAPVDEHDDLSAAGATGRRRFREAALIPLVALAGMVAIAVVAFAASGGEMRPAQPAERPQADAEVEAPVVPFSPEDPYTFRGLDIHPDRLYGQYFAGAFSAIPDDASAETNHLADFRWRLDMYRKAYGVDDNFTIRVLDDRTGETLEVLQLRDVKDRFDGRGQADWDAVNRERRTATGMLRNKWKAYGIPEDNIVIRWGYADQTLEARERDSRYLTYEVNLARRLGLSVLATEIGTVETFNQDRLVSSVGARSRYQMMPDILEMFDVEQYSVPVAAGGSVEVREEQHPLLAMEPYMMLVRAYSNAVGHELPGISAYHTGPGNIFKLYREYIRANPGRARGEHVSDAYMWGVTDGFERVDAVSSFGPQSRVYLLKAYGALRATEDKVIDPEASIHAERVRIKPGTTVSLSQILTALEPHQRRLEWGPINGSTMYERFRDLNAHIDLPMAPGGGVPAAGDLRLSATSRDGKPVRFFLPEGATSVLRGVGLDVIGDVDVFDERTHLLDESEITPADRAYQRLVADAGRFGFTRSTQQRLETIHDQLQALASQNPDSRYRQTQAKVARIHRSIWRTSSFRDLVATTETLLSVDPRVNLGRQPVADLTPDTTPPRRPRTQVDPIPAKPPTTVEDNAQYE